MLYNFNDWHQSHKEIEIPLTILHHVQMDLHSLQPIQIIGATNKEEVILLTGKGSWSFSHKFENFDTLIIRGSTATQKIGFKYTDTALKHHTHVPEVEREPIISQHEEPWNNPLFNPASVQNQFKPHAIRSRFEPEGFPSAYEISDDLEDIFEEDEQFIEQFNAKHKAQRLPEPQIGDSQPLSLSEAPSTTDKSKNDA
ncbi:MAG: internal scaffolding protein [Microviridae sp.]|nr:MAG: internal scaffolding protein [Microviridae sp.]